MSFEKMPRPEGTPAGNAIERIEQGDLPEEELATLTSLKTKALRYGLGLYFHDIDEQSGEPMNVGENFRRQQEKIQRFENRLQAAAKERALHQLSPEEREEYERLSSMSPEQLQESGEGWRDPSEILRMPNVPTM